MSGPEHSALHRAPAHLAGGEPASDQDFILERRHRLVAPHLRSTDRLLDFGCGSGAQTVTFASDVRLIVGADVEPRFLRGCVERMRAVGVDPRGVAVRYDGHTLPLSSASVDVVVTFEVLEHVADEERSLAEIHRVLAAGGRLCMTVPNRWWIFETHGADLPLLPWNRVPFFSWLPKRVHDRWARARNYRRREILARLREHGFEIESSAYVTAPMDVVRSSTLKRWLRRTIFRGDTTDLPMLATAILVIARKSGE